MNKIIWKHTECLGPVIYYGYVGKIRLFSYTWGSWSNKDKNKPYRLKCVLTNKELFFTDDEQLKIRAESILNIIRKEIC